jgi:hypothetical protein
VAQSLRLHLWMVPLPLQVRTMPAENQILTLKLLIVRIVFDPQCTIDSLTMPQPSFILRVQFSIRLMLLNGISRIDPDSSTPSLTQSMAHTAHTHPTVKPEMMRISTLSILQQTTCVESTLQLMSSLYHTVWLRPTSPPITRYASAMSS